MSKSSLIAAAFTVALAGVSGQAFAATEVPVRAVSTAQVDFRNPASVKDLYAKLRVAAFEVCDSNSANPRIAQMDRACAARVLAQTVRTTDRPMLTAAYQAADGKSAIGYASGFNR